MPSSFRVQNLIGIENNGAFQGTTNVLNFTGDGANISIDNGAATISRSIKEGYSLKNIVRYTSPGSGTYVKPDDVDALLITAVGGGAGGSGNPSVWEQFAFSLVNGAYGTKLIWDQDGNLYWVVMSQQTNTSYIYKVTQQGVLSTLTSATAPMSMGTGIIFGQDGSLYWAVPSYSLGGSYNTTSYIYKVALDGTRTTFASTSTIGATYTDLVLGPDGNFYWAINNFYNGSTFNLTGYVYRVTPQGEVSTFASASTEGGQGTALVFDSDGNLFWAVINYRTSTSFIRTSYIYKITPDGTKTTFASVTTEGAMGTSLVIDSNNNLYWAVSNGFIGRYNLTSYVYKITPQGNMTTLASAPTYGTRNNALLFDQSGNLYWAITNYYDSITYSLLNYIYKIKSNGNVSTFAYMSAIGGMGTALSWGPDNKLYWAINNYYNGSTYNLISYVYRSVSITSGSGTGGGAGGCAIKFITSPASSYDYVVGAGGSSSANGGDTTIASMTAYGGSGSAGGDATGGDLNIKGGSASGMRDLICGGESGGDSFFGGGGRGGIDMSASGENGSLGGGGGGSGSESAVGGSGGSGMVEIREYIKNGNYVENGFKNIIINGDMRIAQRGTSFTISQTSSVYTLDRWKQENNHNAGSIAVSQDFSVSPSAGVINSIKISNPNGNDSGMDSDQFIVLLQKIEGHNVRPFIEENLVLSFWVRSSKAGVYCVSLRNGGYDRSYVHEFTINDNNTWERKAVVFPMNYSGGTWDYGDGTGLILTFCLAGGSSYQTTKGSWRNGNYFCTSNQTNWLNETDNSFYLTNVQLEEGTVPTSFEQRPIVNELKLCQRYYQQIGGNQNDLYYRISSAPTNNQFGLTFVLPTTMRALPTVTKHGTWAVFNCNQPSVVASKSTVTIQSTGANSGSYYGWQCNGSDDKISLDAEL